MTRLGIEPRSPGPLANTLLLTGWKYIYYFYVTDFWFFFFKFLQKIICSVDFIYIELLTGII